MYREILVQIVKKVRPILLPSFGVADFESKSSEKRGDIVTKLDFEVERFLKEELSREFPRVPFVGEEGGGDRKDTYWLVDPIDGTEYYVRGIPFCTTMIAFIKNGAPVASVIYDFVNDIAYSAEKDLGAYANSSRISVSKRKLRESRIAEALDLEREENLEIFLALKKKTRIFHVGPSGFDFSMIASGKLDGYVGRNPYSKDYDLIPGAFLVSEAGGIVANMGKQTYDFRNLDFIASNPVVFKELTEGPNALIPTN